MHWYLGSSGTGNLLVVIRDQIFAGPHLEGLRNFQQEFKGLSSAGD